jgi:acyl-CoA synthetase (AMP-forming)/AMP-acid ligase II
MRIALVATAAAAAVAVPLAASVSGPQMTSDEFLSAVRCTAYQNLVDTSADVGEAKRRLNAEARHQPAETAALAQAEVTNIARQAARADAAALSQDEAAACAGAQQTAAADSRRGA